MLVDHLLKTKKEFKNSKKRDTNYIYKNEPDKACFQHDMAYGDFKDLTRRTASDKILIDKAFNFAKIPKYDEYQRGLASMVYNFLIKNPLCLQINLWYAAVLICMQINPILIMNVLWTWLCKN